MQYCVNVRQISEVGIVHLIDCRRDPLEPVTFFVGAGARVVNDRRRDHLTKIGNEAIRSTGFLIGHLRKCSVVRLFGGLPRLDGFSVLAHRRQFVINDREAALYRFTKRDVEQAPDKIMPRRIVVAVFLGRPAALLLG